jgi:aspartyl aminopeptidase
MTAHRRVQDLIDFIDTSPSPWHVAATIENRLRAYAFERLEETKAWKLEAGGRYYVVREDSSIILFVIGQIPLIDSGFKLIGAHTDSPGLRVKPRPVLDGDHCRRLAVEIYGSPILATFTDRDLSLAGRLAYHDESGRIATRLLLMPQAMLRLPNLAIHMNRSVNEDGLKINKQSELAAILSSCVTQELAANDFQQFLERHCSIPADRILSWDLCLYDTQNGGFWGEEQAFYTNSQLDNLASCHAGLSALLDENSLNADATLICAFFDHEEIGSESIKGAAGSFLPDVLQRIANGLDLGPSAYAQALAQSFMISADMAHAYHPNYPAAYEPNHKIIVNQGPVIKNNANQRYASDALSTAQFIDYCRQAGVSYQLYAHPGDLPCGSTIGPIASAKLGIRTVDVGCPMWAMHSIRESAGVQDHHDLIRVFSVFFNS